MFNCKASLFNYIEAFLKRSYANREDYNKNFKGIESYTGEVNGKNIYLIGPNAANKTSFIDAIWAGLEGPKYMPSEPITKGKPSGLIEIDLGEFIARTKLKQGKK